MATNTTPCGCGKSAAKTEKCKCGCDGHQDSCCTIDCLERPHFFCGQLLTDQDFNKLAEWIGRKSDLKRFLHGWGIVCGMDVTVDPCDCASIGISSGYAIDCCGRDLVVCDPLQLSLKDKYCVTPDDPCGTLGTTTSNAVRPGAGTPARGAVDFGGMQIPQAELTGIDIFIRYSEQLGRPQRQASSGKCSSSSDPCQYTRISEIPEICTKPAPLAELLPGKDKYQTQLGSILSDLTQPQYGQDVDAFNRYLAGAFQRNYGGLHRFSFVSQLSRANSRDWVQQLPYLAYWLVQDWHLSYAVNCVECDDSTAVPLARVMLRTYVEAGNKKCCIVYVEQAPPYRRALQKKTETSLVPYLWRPLDEPTRAVLARMQVEISAMEPLKMAMKDLQAEFERGVYSIAPGTPAVARVVTFQDQQRIALFQRNNA